jgi:hypothetical protein
MDIKEKLKAVREILDTRNNYDEVVEAYILYDIVDSLICEDEVLFHDNLRYLTPRKEEKSE